LSVRRTSIDDAAFAYLTRKSGEVEPLNDLYAAGRPNLEGRAIFTNSTPGKPDAAFFKRNEPRGANAASIQDLVRKGYLVRIRSDVRWCAARDHTRRPERRRLHERRTARSRRPSSCLTRRSGATW
jgi:Phosphoinositide phospholipase C, Ca2+-dependent